MKVLAVISLLVLLVASVHGYTSERQYQREFSKFVKTHQKRKQPHNTRLPNAAYICYDFHPHPHSCRLAVY